MKDEALAARCRALRLVLSDVDGVMTDGRVTFLPDGGEAKAFHIRDGLGVVMAHHAGLKTGLVSGRLSALVERRAAELHMSIVRLGVRNKKQALQEILASESLLAHQVAYIGDDLNDIPIMREVGLSGAPADAPFEVRSEAFMITQAAGGRGALREFLEAILRARGDWDATLAWLGAAPS